MRRTLIGLGSALIALSAASCTDVTNPSGGRALPAYVTSDSCSGYAEQAGCDAAPGGACAWMAVEADCAPGANCPTGACAAVDPCGMHDNPSACQGDTANGCAWAAMDYLCPAGALCPEQGGGFCHQPQDDCVCACPLYCPEGADCPPCACDCSGGGSTGGGGTCTCACPDCPPGEACPPCECTCTNDGCVDDGTCTCACPACEPGTECPPCECSCSGSSGGSAGTGTAVCACPDCEPGTECPPCECEEPVDPTLPPDPCLEWVSETDCLADVENACTWIAMGMPCDPSMPDCRSGVCQQPSAGDDCACVCADCAPDETCPPCVCDCGAGGGEGCVPGGDTPAEPPQIDPDPQPAPEPR